MWKGIFVLTLLLLLTSLLSSCETLPVVHRYLLAGDPGSKKVKYLSGADSTLEYEVSGESWIYTRGTRGDFHVRLKSTGTDTVQLAVDSAAVTSTRFGYILSEQRIFNESAGGHWTDSLGASFAIPPAESREIIYSFTIEPPSGNEDFLFYDRPTDESLVVKLTMRYLDGRYLPLPIFYGKPAHGLKAQ